MFPLVCQPAAVECVSTEQTHGGDQYDDQRIHCFYLFPFFHAANRPGAQRRPADEAGPQGVKKPSSIRKIFLGRKIFPEDEGSHIHCTLWMILLRGTTSLAVGGQPLPRMAHLPCCPVTGAGRRCITQDGQGPVHTRCLQGRVICS